MSQQNVPTCQANTQGGGAYSNAKECAKHCHRKSKSSGLTGGEILLVVFFCGLVIPYVVLGMVYMRVRNHATGTDMIPNKAFWIEVPGLIREGFRFTFSRVRRTQYEPL